MRMKRGANESKNPGKTISGNEMQSKLIMGICGEKCVYSEVVDNRRPVNERLISVMGRTL